MTARALAVIKGCFVKERLITARSARVPRLKKRLGGALRSRKPHLLRNHVRPALQPVHTGWFPRKPTGGTSFEFIVRLETKREREREREEGAKGEGGGRERKEARETMRMREREEGATINNSPGVSSALDGESLLLAGRATLPLPLPVRQIIRRDGDDSWKLTWKTLQLRNRRGRAPSLDDDGLLLHHRVNYCFIIDSASLSIRATH